MSHTFCQIVQHNFRYVVLLWEILLRSDHMSQPALSPDDEARVIAALVALHWMDFPHAHCFARETTQSSTLSVSLAI